jgi:chromosome segregation ATPase
VMQDELAMCKAGVSHMQGAATDAQELSQSIQALEEQVCLMGRNLVGGKTAMGRLTAQQAANNHSMAVVASQQVQLQSRVNTLEALQAQTGDSARAHAAFLGRLEELEAHSSACHVTVAGLEIGQADLKQAWTHQQEIQAKDGLQDAGAEQISQLEKGLAYVEQRSFHANELASAVDKQQKDMRAELESHCATLAAITEQQAALLSSIAALEVAQVAVPATSNAHRDSASTDLERLEDKVTWVAAEMEALADQAASSDAAPSTEMSLDQQSKLQADEQHFAQELTAVKAQIEQINLAMVSEAAKFGAALSGLSGAQSSMAATVESMQGQLGHAAGELGQLSAAVKEAKAAAANARQHASSCVEGVQAQVGAWTSSMEALGADHELAAQETSKALKMLARINADNKAMQHAQLDLVTDCASQQAAITQLQAAGASTTANTVRLSLLDTFPILDRLI